MLKSLSAASLTLLLTGAAAPAMAQSTGDWSGPYVGVFGAFIQPDDDQDETLVFDRNLDGNFGDTVVDSNGDDVFTGFCGDLANANSAGPQNGRVCTTDSTGYEAGVRGGWDWQFGGNWVVGAVADVSLADQRDSVSGFSNQPEAFYSLTRNLEHMAALRLRAGYAAGPALGYLTGGVAYGKIENRFFTSNGTNTFTVLEDEDDADGFQFGGGVEWRLAPSLTLNGEYLYTDLDTGEHVIRAGANAGTPVDNPFVLAPNTTGTNISREADSFKTHSFRIGFNVQF